MKLRTNRQLFAGLTLLLLTATGAMAQTVSVTWEMGDINNLGATVMTGDAAYTGLIATDYSCGNNIARVTALSASGADTANGYTAVSYTPSFATFTPTTKVSGVTAGHDVTFTLTPATGHTLKLTHVSFDCVRVGTDGGGLTATLTPGVGVTRMLQPVTMLRNKIAEGNATGYGHNEYDITGINVTDKGLQLVFSIYDLNGTDTSSPKSIGLRNITIVGEVDAEAGGDDPSQPERPDHGTAVPLNRGLMALHTSSGNLVSWRARSTDSRNYKFRLFRGTTESTQNVRMYNGNYIVGKTNFLDINGKAGNYYRLEVYDDNSQLIETEVSGPAWNDQTKYITLEGGAPIDPTSAKATYTPNDASYCDMDGDGEYEIILKWVPSNEKDAASDGVTSPAFYACYKLDGTRLWMLHTGHNMFNSAHTTPFIAWDLDGDGFGEFMVKTAPGAVDGKGNYVLLNGDSPTANLKSGRGKQDHGGEYITVFDGVTGQELKTIPYHTAYADESTSFWGDSKQNRSERYLAAIAWLDGEDQNPSAIFARGYYNGCKIGAYDWDGQNLTLRWLHRGESKEKGTVTYADGSKKNLTKTVYGEGAHWISVGDVTGDGRQEIHYGSGALKPDGTTLYRTGFGHGDALHLGDFIPSRQGLELFMAHEKDPYGTDLRDAKTGQVLWRKTATGDTGRGLMAHFNPEADDAYWQSSASAALFDTDCNTILDNATHGGGASLNNRLYWNNTLADDFYDKNVLEYYNPEANGFWRMQVNGGNYVYGERNNGTKYNPCVLGDMLGDWREEIVTWQKDGDDFQLIINATNYETDYTLPHLMDDYAYRAQVINQNCAYNQPPHLSYDPRTAKTIVPETFEAETTNSEQNPALGRYWGTLFTTYPVIIPEGVMAWSVNNRSTEGKDTLKLNRIAAGKIIPKNRSIIFNSTTATPRFVPTSLTSNAAVSTTYAKGFYCDTLVAEPANGYQYAYEFRTGERGVGFYRTYGNKTIQGGQAYAIFGTLASPGTASYVLGKWLNPASPEGVVPEIVKGDVNGDGDINIVDVTSTISHILGQTPDGFDETAADVNNDNRIDIVDVTSIIDMILSAR